MTLVELEKALEEATKGNRELDARLVCMARGWRFSRVINSGTTLAYYAPGEGETLTWLPDLPAPSTSVDAALSLAREALPAEEFAHSNMAALLHAVTHQKHMGDVGDDEIALAVCRYVVRALRQKEGE